MKTFAVTGVFVFGLVLGKILANDLVLMALVVLIFAAVVAGVLYQSGAEREDHYSREYRKSRDRRMREVHLGHDLSDYGRPE